MAPGTDDADNAWGARWSHPWLTALGVAVAIASGLVSIIYTYTNNESARAADARNARQSLVTNVLAMEDYVRRTDDGYNNAVRLLASDSDALIAEFGQDRLHLSPTLYRAAAEYVTYGLTDFDGNDMDIAERMAQAAIDTSPAGGLEALRGHRVLGSVAAQRGDLAASRDHFDMASTLARDYLEEEPTLGVRVDELTRVNRLLGAYLGAIRTEDAELKVGFCDLAREGAGDLGEVARKTRIWWVALQLERLGVDDPTELPALCGAAPS